MDSATINDLVIQSEKRLNELPFIFKINDKIYSKQDLEEWQKREYLKTAKLLNKHFSSKLNVNQDTPFLTLKKEVILTKMTIGQDALRSELSDLLKKSALLSSVSAKASFGKRRVSIADIFLRNSRLKAEQIIKVWQEMMTINSKINQFYNFKANPNHFYSFGSTHNQTVVEMTGGTRIANEFTLNYGVEEGLRTHPNPHFSFQSAGVAKSENETVIGGVRHLMTDEADKTFHARLQVEFPAVMPNYFIKQHSIHLLVEFSNWLTDVDLVKSSARQKHEENNY